MIEHDLKHCARRATAKISCEILHDLLALPKDVRVLGVVQNSEDLLYGRLTLVLESESLPARSKPGEVYPEVSLIYRNEPRPAFVGFT